MYDGILDIQYYEKVVLLGANGQLGQDIVNKFKSEDIELVCLTRASLDAENYDDFSVFDGLSTIDIIINTISYHKTDECEDFVEKF